MIGLASGSSGGARALGTYLISQRRSAAAALIWAPALVVAGALVEGVGIMLIVPGVAMPTDSAALPVRMTTAIGLVPLRRGALLPAIMAALFVLLLARGVVLWQRDQVMARLSLSLVDAWRERVVRALAHADGRSSAGCD